MKKQILLLAFFFILGRCTAWEIKGKLNAHEVINGAAIDYFYKNFNERNKNLDEEAKYVGVAWHFGSEKSVVERNDEVESYANRYTGADKIPPVDIQKVVIDRQLNVEVNTTDRFYMFFAPNDGHALVFYTDSSTQTWLYDPSFGSGKYGAIKVDFPDLGKDTIIKRLGIATNTEIWSYLAKSIGYLRGFTYFKDHNIYKGISVFDIPFNSVNYLKVRFRKYVDYTFSYWGD